MALLKKKKKVNTSCIKKNMKKFGVELKIGLKK